MATTEKKKVEEVSKTAFVICPIGDGDSPERKRSDQILKHVIKPVVEKFGYKATRADQISKPGIITSQIVDHILNDPLVIADLTSKNANVFYELAVRHVIRKPIIQIIQKGERIPFDVSAQRTIEIDHKDLDSVEEAMKELEKQIIAVEKDPALVDSPISTAISIQSLKGSTNPEQAAIVAIQGTLSNLVGEMREIRNRLQRESSIRYHTTEPVLEILKHLDDDEIKQDILKSDLNARMKHLEDDYKNKLEEQLEARRRKMRLMEK